ncbi:MAG: hypothetical protein R3C10_23495 [Pirellulales bacterium]
MQPYQISVKRCFRSEPTEGNSESPNPSAASTSVIRKTENGYEEGCARGGGKAKEKLIPTPGGLKTGRRPDIIFETANGQIRGKHIGRVDASGNPKPREIDALKDLNGPGKLPTDFVPYN